MTSSQAFETGGYMAHRTLHLHHDDTVTIPAGMVAVANYIHGSQYKRGKEH
jgi:hypothetical protein